MTGLNIYKDHTIYHHNMRERHPSIERLSLARFKDIALRGYNYSIYMQRVERIKIYKSTDYEGGFRDSYNFCFPASTINERTDTRMAVTFEDMGDDDYDYVSTETRDTSTAYKWGSKGTPKEVKFKINIAVIKREKGDVESWFECELTRLQIILDGLDEATKSLRSWAEHGIDMRVVCPNCTNAAIIPSGRLLTYVEHGLSLDQFKRKLKCKECGSGCNYIGVA
jgi:hypothetical protein